MTIRYAVVTATAMKLFSSRKRVYSEDAYVIARDGDAMLFAVVDGHGFSALNTTVRDFAWQVAADFSLLGQGVRTPEAMHALFAEISHRADRWLVHRGCTDGERNVGAVAACAVATKDTILYGKLGDCNLAEVGVGLYPFLPDHSAGNPEELKRVMAVCNDEVCLKYGKLTAPIPGSKQRHLLNVFRAFGDIVFRPAVIPTPDVVLFERRPWPYALVSDGGWSPTIHANYDSKTREVDAIAHQARKAFKRRLPSDDATIILFSGF